MLFYEQLLADTEEGKQYLLSAPLIGDVFNGSFTLNTYLAFLHQAYQHVRHTAPLLSSAMHALNPEQQWVSGALSEYIKEEAGHEQWILDDIAACGFDRDEYEQRPPSFESELMVSYLYDYVNRTNPMGIFGMVLVLEGTSATLAPNVAGVIQTKLGLADNAMTYLTTHGELDQDHIRHFESVMNRVDDPRDQADITHVANRVYRLYGDVFRSIPATASTLAVAA